MNRLCCAVLLCLLALPSFASNLITNGSFETPVVPVGSFTDYATGSNLITGWTVVGAPGASVAIVSGSFQCCGATFPAEDGVQWLDLTGGNSNQFGEGVEQSISTTPGHIYQLSLYVGNTTALGVTSTVDISINGTSTFSDTNSIPNPNTLVWEQFTHTFNATKNTTVLDFLNGDPSNDNNNGLDNIVLTDLGTPEPASLLLAASGGLAVFSALRRRLR